MWIWHAPPLYEAALGNPAIHLAQHACFTGAALLFWWTALRPISGQSYAPLLGRLVYLFVAAIPSSLLGILLTFSGSPLYPSYVRAAGSPLGLSLMSDWNLTPLADQQLGGLLMWVPGGLVYLLAIVWLWVRWSSRSGHEVALAARVDDARLWAPTSTSERQSQGARA